MNMANRVTGIKIGKNYLTLVGLITLIVLVLLIIAGILAAVLHFTSGDEASPNVSATPVPH